MITSNLTLPKTLHITCISLDGDDQNLIGMEREPVG